MDKTTVDYEGLGEKVREALEEIQKGLLEAARQRLAEGTRAVESYAEMRDAILAGEGGMFLASWTDDRMEEEAVKNECKATIRCFPLGENEGGVRGRRCFKTGREATHMAVFARAF